MPENEELSHFIIDAIDADLASGRVDHVHTRFPPEPNGYMHIGSAKAAWINHSIARRYGGRFNLRFDDTDPVGEDMEYVESFQEDFRWLGFHWDELRFASDYFDQLHDWARQLIDQGDAFVCDLTPEQMREFRGTLTEPGRPSPFRDRSIAENHDLFERMKAGEFADGSKTLRAKIDMAAANMNLRDPVMYRIKRAHHYRLGSQWCIYPSYDFTHGQSDSLEGITHSLCSLEFEDHRPLYDWFIQKLGIFPSRQIEFARMNVTYTVTSKRYLKRLVAEKHVSGWDDPRMPTIRGMRRRGIPPEAIRAFCGRAGVTKFNSVSDVALLEHCVREELNRTSPRAMAVLDPVKVIIESYPEDLVEEMEAVNNPEDATAGTRMVPFSRELYIERADFMEDAPRKFFRLAPGREVRLRYGYWVTCTGIEKDPQSGEVTLIRCTHDPETRGGESPPDGRKVKGTLHWVSASHAVEAEVRLYDRLFTTEEPTDVAEDGDFTDNLNSESLRTVTGYLEPSLGVLTPGERVQFERIGYFCVDDDSTPEQPIFNRTVPLRDSWAKQGGGR